MSRKKPKPETLPEPLYDPDGKLTRAGLDNLGRLVLESCPEGLPFMDDAERA